MKKQFLIFTPLILLASCTTQDRFEARLEETLVNNPQILTKIIEKNPDKFVIAFQNAVKQGQQKIVEQRKINEEIELKKSIENPLKPNIRKDELIRGTKGAPITIVEYSDFECPYCSKGFETVKALLKKYDGKIRLVYKHLPLSFHKEALPAAHYYEAIRLQSADKAFKFHDAIFDNQRKLSLGEPFLKKMAKQLSLIFKQMIEVLSKLEWLRKVKMVKLAIKN